jgi:hypothetical protein
LICSNRPCGVPVTVDDCSLVRDEGTMGRLIPLCGECARLYLLAHPDRFTPVR